MERIKKFLPKNRFGLFAVVLMANVILYTSCLFLASLSEKQLIVKDEKGLSFDGAKDKPLSVFDDLPVFYDSFSMNFEADFFPKDDNYSNIFQTGGDPKTLRIELIHPNLMQVIVGYKDDPGLKVYPISNKVKVNEWNHVVLNYSKDRTLSVKLNDEKEMVFRDSKFDPRVNDVVLGAGFDKQRVFVGMIKNVKFNLNFNETNVFLYVPSLMLKYYPILVFSQILFLFINYIKRQNSNDYRYYVLMELDSRLRGNDKRENSGRKVKLTGYEDVFKGFLVTFAIVAITVIAVGKLTFPWAGQDKWLAFLSLLLPAFLIGLSYVNSKVLLNKYFYIAAIALSSVVFLFGLLNYEPLSWIGTGGVLIIFMVLAFVPLMRKFMFVSSGIFVFLFAINSFVYINNFGEKNYVWTLFVLLLMVGFFIFTLFEKNKIKRILTINRVVFVILLCISAVLALRTDSLFLGSGEFHWNYYVSVIETLRSGGELLWSAPSQYGLLNVLLSNILPWSARNSFFVFQAVLFVVCTFIILRVMYLSFRKSIAFVFLGFIALSLFYFADPSLIGPTLFPSSSVMRFFWCYVLIYMVLREYSRGTILNGGIKWGVLSAYVLGSLWSAESFLYCTAIFGIYLLSSAFVIFKTDLRRAFAFLLANVSVIFVVLVVVNIVYLIATSHFSDWSMYFMYAFSYASGYGELVINPWGIHWAAIITFSAIVFVAGVLYSTKKYSEWIVLVVCGISLWVVSSYYVGRAVVNNFTALLPFIFYIFVVLVYVLLKPQFKRYRFLLYVVFLPWIVAGLIGGIGNPQFIGKSKEFKFAENIDAKSFQADRELGSVFRELGLEKGVRIVYYGDPYNNPVVHSGDGKYVELRTGIPMPMTLLEEPISPHRREVVVKRFVEKVDDPIFVIHRKNGIPDRFEDWKKFLDDNFLVKEVDIRGDNYEVLRIEKK